MNIKLLASSLLAGALVLPLAGHAATDGDTDRSSAKAFVKDSVITAKVKAKLTKAKLSNAVHIKVDTDQNGVVSLGGTARSKAEAERAEAIARGVEGVTAVENNIKIVARKQHTAAVKHEQY